MSQNQLISHFESKKGWWLETRATIPAALPKGGLIVKFHLADVQSTLDKHYPYNSRHKVWYFNTTRDREIAEHDNEFVYANPQVLISHFMTKGP